MKRFGRHASRRGRGVRCRGRVAGRPGARDVDLGRRRVLDVGGGRLGERRLVGGRAGGALAALRRRCAPRAARHRRLRAGRRPLGPRRGSGRRRGRHRRRRPGHPAIRLDRDRRHRGRGRPPRRAPSGASHDRPPPARRAPGPPGRGRCHPVDDRAPPRRRDHRRAAPRRGRPVEHHHRGLRGWPTIVLLLGGYVAGRYLANRPWRVRRTTIARSAS